MVVPARQHLRELPTPVALEELRLPLRPLRLDRTLHVRRLEVQVPVLEVPRLRGRLPVSGALVPVSGTPTSVSLALRLGQRLSRPSRPRLGTAGDSVNRRLGPPLPRPSRRLPDRRDPHDPSGSVTLLAGCKSWRPTTPSCAPSRSGTRLPGLRRRGGGRRGGAPTLPVSGEELPHVLEEFQGLPTRERGLWVRRVHLVQGSESPWTPPFDGSRGVGPSRVSGAVPC